MTGQSPDRLTVVPQYAEENKTSTEADLSQLTRREKIALAIFFLLIITMCGGAYHLFFNNNDENDDLQSTLAAVTATLGAMDDAELTRVAIATQDAYESLTLTAEATNTPTPTATLTPSPTATPPPSPTNQFTNPQFRLEDDPNIPSDDSDVDIYFETLRAEYGEIESIDQVFEITRVDIDTLKKLLSAYGIEEAAIRALLPNIDNLSPFPNIQELIAESDYLHRQLSPITERGVDVDPAQPETSGLNMTARDLEILSSDEQVENFVDLWTPESWTAASNLRIEDGSSPSEVSLIPVDGLMSRALADQDLDLGVVSEDGEHKYLLAFPQIDNIWPTLKVTAIDYLADETNGSIDINKLHEASDIFANLVTTHLLGEGQGAPIQFVFNEPDLGEQGEQFISTMQPHPFIDVREYYDGPVENNGQQSPFGNPIDQNTRLRCVVVNDNLVSPEADPNELSWWSGKLPSNNVGTLSISIPPNENLANSDWLAQATAAEIAQEMFESAVVLAGQASAEYQDTPDREVDFNPDESVVRGITFIKYGCEVAPPAAPAAPAEQPQFEQPPGGGQPPGGEETPIIPNTPVIPQATPTEKSPGEPPTPVPTDITGDQPTHEPTPELSTPEATAFPV